MKKVFHILMLSCKKAAELIDKKVEIKLSRKENFQLMLHKSMCTACAAYEKQSKLISSLIKANMKSEDIANLPTIENKELIQKISSKL